MAAVTVHDRDMAAATSSTVRNGGSTRSTCGANRRRPAPRGQGRRPPPAVAEHDDPGRAAGREFDVVGGKDHRPAPGGVVAHRPLESGTRRRVDPAGRLVEQEDCRPRPRRRRRSPPAGVAPRQRAGVAIGEVGQPERSSHRSTASGSLRPRSRSVCPPRRTRRGEEQAVGVLGHVGRRRRHDELPAVEVLERWRGPAAGWSCRRRCGRAGPRPRPRRRRGRRRAARVAGRGSTVIPRPATRTSPGVRAAGHEAPVAASVGRRARAAAVADGQGRRDPNRAAGRGGSRGAPRGSRPAPATDGPGATGPAAGRRARRGRPWARPVRGGARPARSVVPRSSLRRATRGRARRRPPAGRASRSARRARAPPVPPPARRRRRSAGARRPRAWRASGGGGGRCRGRRAPPRPGGAWSAWSVPRFSSTKARSCLDLVDDELGLGVLVDEADDVGQCPRGGGRGSIVRDTDVAREACRRCCGARARWPPAAACSCPTRTPPTTRRTSPSAISRFDVGQRRSRTRIGEADPLVGDHVAPPRAPPQRRRQRRQCDNGDDVESRCRQLVSGPTERAVARGTEQGQGDRAQPRRAGQAPIARSQPAPPVPRAPSAGGGQDHGRGHRERSDDGQRQGNGFGPADQGNEAPAEAKQADAAQDAAGRLPRARRLVAESAGVHRLGQGNGPLHTGFEDGHDLAEQSTSSHHPTAGAGPIRFADRAHSRHRRGDERQRNGDGESDLVEGPGRSEHQLVVRHHRIERGERGEDAHQRPALGRGTRDHRRLDAAPDGEASEQGRQRRFRQSEQHLAAAVGGGGGEHHPEGGEHAPGHQHDREGTSEWTIDGIGLDHERARRPRRRRRREDWVPAGRTWPRPEPRATTPAPARDAIGHRSRRSDYGTASAEHGGSRCESGADPQL